MSEALRPFLDRWRLCALAVAAIMLAIAHGFETFGDLVPCALCLRQREIYWVIGGLSLAFMVVVRLPGGPRFREASCWILGLLFAASCAVAAYHAGVEWKIWPGPTACAAHGGAASAAGAMAMLNSHSYAGPSCEDAAWRLAGLSMAGWNAVVSLLLAVLSGAAGLRERSKR
jgi:disulfide bond formation protein DsbB